MSSPETMTEKEKEVIEDLIDTLERAMEHLYMANRPEYQRHISLCDPDGDGIGVIEIEDLSKTIPLLKALL